jgi:threonine aldolase
MKKSFASDNFSPVHEKIMDAILIANNFHQRSYGYDEFTKRAILDFKKILGEDIDIYFVYNGTAANVLSIKTFVESYHSVICAKTAHINVDECGALQNYVGCRIHEIETKNGKITPNDIKSYLHEIGNEHASQPKLISISNSNELGLVYTKDELLEITNFAHKNNMFVHVDGARISNAAASLNLSLKEITKDVNIDVLSFGGTKNSMMFGEAVIFFNKNYSKEKFKYIRKQGMQLYSKLRYISAQFSALLSDDLYLNSAKRMNDMAKYLEKKIKELNYFEIVYPVESNAVFIKMEKEIYDKFIEKYYIYEWDIKERIVRFMISYDITKRDVDEMISFLKSLI